MSHAPFDPDTGYAGISSTHLMFSRFLLVLKMSVLDIIR